MVKRIGKIDKAFGIELSDSSIKIISFALKGKKYKLIGSSIKRLRPGLIVDGEIRNEEKVLESLDNAYRNTKPKKINDNFIISALPENKTFVRIIEIPTMSVKEINKAIKWEAEKYIPMPVNKSYIDWQIISKNSKKIKILLAVAPKNLVSSYLKLFEEAGFKTVALELEVAAQARSLIPSKDKEEKHLIVDIGTRRTIFSIFENEVLHFSSSTPEISGNYFTAVIAKEMGLKKEEAEKVKIKCCSATLTKEERKLLKSIQPAYDKLALEIEKIIRYYRRHNKITKSKFKIILCGGGAGAHGMDSYLSLKLRQKVVVGNPWTNINLKKDIDFKNKKSLIFAKAIGLAMRGVKYKEYMGHD